MGKMQVWAIVSQKGGAGKTTVALHLAVAATLDHKRVIIINLDPQQSAVKWGRIRDADSPRVISTIAPDLDKTLKEAEREGMNLAIIDTSPRADRDALNVCRRSDFIVIPCRPSMLDVSAVDETMKLIATAGKTNHAVMVLNEVPAHTSEGEEAADYLKQIGELLPVQLGDRAAFRQALTNGRGVTEFAPKSAAAKEAANLYKAIKERTRL